jgi:hypothetical protein
MQNCGLEIIDPWPFSVGFFGRQLFRVIYLVQRIFFPLLVPFCVFASL